MKVSQLVQRMQGERSHPQRRECYVEYNISMPEALRLQALQPEGHIGLTQAIHQELAVTRPHASREEIGEIVGGHIRRIRRAYRGV